MPRTEKVSSGIQDVASKLRGPGSPFRMLSGKFRDQVAATMGAMDEMTRERHEVQEDRRLIRKLLIEHRRVVEHLSAEFRGQGEAFATRLDDLGATAENIHRIQHRAVDFASRQDQLREAERHAAELNEALERRQGEFEAIFARIEERVAGAARLQESVQQLQSTLVEGQRDGLAMIERLEAQLQGLSEREQELAGREAAASARTETLAEQRRSLEEQERELSGARSAVAEERTRLSALCEKVEKGQSDINRMHEKLVGHVEGALAHEERMQLRLREFEDKRQEHEQRNEELAAIKLERDRERVELDARIERLRDLDTRDEEILRARAHLDAEQKRLDEDFARVKAQQEQLGALECRVGDVLEKAQEVEARVETTHDVVQKVREETLRREEVSGAQLAEREQELLVRERAILKWRLQAELRERKIQERYDELGRLERRKAEVQEAVAHLEQEQAERISRVDRDLQEQRRAIERQRGEAERARRLYERNAGQLEKWNRQLEEKEKRHREREALLDSRTAELAEREHRIRVLEEQIDAMREQQLELRGIISSLTTQIGSDMPVPGGGFEHDLALPERKAPSAAAEGPQAEAPPAEAEGEG